MLETPDVYGNELLRAEASRFVVVSAISAFGLVTEPRREASVSAAVRRATAWVDEHRREPITVQDIAAAARLSPRGLSLAFRRERGQTPMEYVRLARVDGARADLVAGDPTRGTPSRASLPTGGSATPAVSRRCTGRRTASRRVGR